jgi:hypothetical protein
MSSTVVLIKLTFEEVHNQMRKYKNISVFGCIHGSSTLVAKSKRTGIYHFQRRRIRQSEIVRGQGPQRAAEPMINMLMMRRMITA